MRRYPLKLSYITKTALWGGKKLSEEWGKRGDCEIVSESWELSVRSAERSAILNGEAEGMTLAEYFETVGYSAVAKDFSREDTFPLLIKLIDARDKLSLQVHPDDEYAKSVENDVGKTEMWYIVSADEGASIIYGLADGVSEEDFAKAVKSGKTEEAVKRVSVKAGETYFIPSGLVHAIGAGILIAEIQQNSDLTYRVYDYDRVGADGKLRELHIDKAIAVTKAFDEDKINGIRFSRKADNSCGELLANCEYFTVEKLCVDGNIKLCSDERSFSSLLVIDGEGVIRFGEESYALGKGDSYFIPADMGDYIIEGKLTVIKSGV